jgi:hypothetical protein
MSELTEKINKGLGKKTLDIFNDLKGADGLSNPTVEDLINYLIKLGKLVSSRKNPKFDWTTEEVEKAIITIQTSVVESIGNKWESSQDYSNFLERIFQTTKKSREIFTLNYDTLIEASLESLRLSYNDGFNGSENAYFDQMAFESNGGRCFNIYKLHGSINWVRDEKKIVRRRPTNSKIENNERYVIYPAEQKYVQTQYGVYEILLNRFRAVLRRDCPNNKLVVMGYGFGDEHINVAIEDAIVSPGSKLTVFGFVGAGLAENRKEALKNMAARCDNRFNIFVGKNDYIGTSLETQEWQDIITKGEDLSRFENIVKLLSGTKNG